MSDIDISHLTCLVVFDRLRRRPYYLLDLRRESGSTLDLPWRLPTASLNLDRHVGSLERICGLVYTKPLGTPPLALVFVESPRHC